MLLQGVTSVVYSAADESLVLVEADLNRISRVYSTTDARKTGLRTALHSVLVESGALPVTPLILIIFDFVIGDSTF